MEILGEENSLAKASCMQWHGRVLRKQNENVIAKASACLKCSIAEEEEDKNEPAYGKDK